MRTSVVQRMAAAAVVVLGAMACSGRDPSTESRPSDITSGRADSEVAPTDADACFLAGPQAERTVISRFFTAYNDGAEDKVQRLATLSGVWDPVAAPYTGTLRPDFTEWVGAGRQVQDELEIVDLCVYPDRGADGQLIRRNDVLANAGIVRLTQAFKVQMDTGAIERLVLYMPEGKAKRTFCLSFGEAMRQVQSGRNPQC